MDPGEASKILQCPRPRMRASNLHSGVGMHLQISLEMGYRSVLFCTHVAIDFFKADKFQDNCAISVIRDLCHILVSGDFLAAIGLFAGVRELSTMSLGPAGDDARPLRPHASSL